MAERLRVLIIEDSPTMRAVCARSLTEAGMDCETAGSAEEGQRLLAAALAQGRPFDGLLLDWLLPGMPGSELLRGIGSDSRFDQLSVMIFTEQPDDLAYRLASERPNNDIQLKEDLTLLPYRMRKFLTTYGEHGGMGSWRARQMQRSREKLSGSILFVDDSPTVCSKYASLLRHNGYQVEVARSMAEALERARHTVPQLAVVDYYMPGGNGDELCRALLADPVTRDVTVVMHSQSKEVIEDALNAGAIDLIWKDDPINIFLMRIASIVRTLRAHRQAKHLDILFSATETLGVGVMLCGRSGFRAFNGTMERFAADCGGLERFRPAVDESLQQRIEDREGVERAFNIYRVREQGDDAMVLVQDVTAMADQAQELALARDQAMESARAKSQFLANMSHEIRTPLNGVLGMLELLRGTELGHEQRHYVETAAGSAELLLGVIGDVLDFSKIEAGRLELEETDLDLPGLLEDTVALFAQKAQAKGLELICQLDPSLPERVRGDSTRIRQVLTNLIGNAVKFTEVGEVKVSAEPAQAADGAALIAVSVCDTGIGMGAEALEHIFEAFRQADSSTTRRFGGTGLGLAICHRLVGMMGGEIGVDSAPGAGSSFRFTLRLETVPGVAAAPADASVLAGKRVLIVDDNATNRLLLRGLCRGWGMHTQEAEQGVQALAALEREARAGRTFDLVLLDRMMPHMDGIEVLQCMREQPALARIPVVLQTSLDEAGEAQRARALGARGHLLKPIRRASLLDTLCGLFGGARPAAERPGPQAEANRLEGVRILAVEDNAVNQQVITGILTRAGCEVEVAENGQAALDALAGERFDAVLMDVEMPVMDGLTATRSLRAREGEGSHQVVVALTAHAIPAERDRCLEAGMDDYLSKPIRPKELLATLQRWVAAGRKGRDEQAETSGVQRQSTGAAHPPGPSVPGEPLVPDRPGGRQEPMDLRQLERLREALGDVGPVVEALLEDLPRRMRALEVAFSAQDAAAVERQAHAIAGSAANAGGRRLHQLGKALEKAATEGLEGQQPLLVQMQEAAESFLEWLKTTIDAWQVAEVRNDPEAAPAGA